VDNEFSFRTFEALIRETLHQANHGH